MSATDTSIACASPVDLSRNVGAQRPESKPAGRRLISVVVPEFWNELLEAFDGAVSAHARVDGIAPGADAIVLGLKIEAAVEIERGTILIELRSETLASGRKDEIDLLGGRHERSTDARRRDALGALMLFPFDPGQQRVRLDWHPDDDLVLHDEPGNRLFDDAGLTREQAEQDRHEVEERSRNHLEPAAIVPGFAAKR